MKIVHGIKERLRTIHILSRKKKPFPEYNLYPELERFRERIDQIRNWNPRLDYQISDFPSIRTFENRYSDYIHFYIPALTAIMSSGTTKESVEVFVSIWDAKHLSNLALPVRLIFEHWTALAFLYEMISYIRDNFENDTFQRFLSLFEDEAIGEIIDTRRHFRRMLDNEYVLPEEYSHHQTFSDYLNLSQDSKRALLNYVKFFRHSDYLPLPLQFNYQFRYIRLQTFRESLARTNTDAHRSYTFLSEACHPNFYRLAGLAHSQNRSDIVERTLSELEGSLQGLLEVANRILELCVRIFDHHDDLI